MVHGSQAFAPVIERNGGGAIVNVLSDAVWFSRPVIVMVDDQARLVKQTLCTEAGYYLDPPGIG